MQDEKIVELYWLRDESAIEETRKKYENYLRKIAYNILYNIEDSRESVNDTYLAAWESMPPHRPSILSSYLGKIARRISIDVFRRKQRQKRCLSEYELSLDELSDVASTDELPQEQFDVKALGDRINAFLLTLDQKERNLFVLRYFFFEPLKSAAKSCRMSESAAKSMLFRTRCALKTFLESEGYTV